MSREVTNIICTVLIASGAIFLLISIIFSNRITKLVPSELKRKWQYLRGLMTFFFCGYIMFNAVLLTAVDIPLDVIAGGIFLGGAMFVFLVIKLSGQTLLKVKNGEQDLKTLNANLNDKNMALEQAITNCRIKEDKIQLLAYYDNITGLPNRALFMDRLNQAIINAKLHKYLVGLLFMDLDNFKRINDSLGHQVGDHLLKAVADRLEPHLRKSDMLSVSLHSDNKGTEYTMARHGGDEFLILLNEIERPEHAARVASRLLDAMTTPFRVDSHDIYIASSIGIALYPRDCKNAEDLIKCADIAMYESKTRGGTSYAFYKNSMNDKSLRRIEIEKRLRRALKHGEFIVNYQPILDLKSCRVTKMEALLRWQDPDLGAIPPAEFIPLAEETGLIIPLGEWVLHHVCEQGEKWQEEGTGPVALSINVSGKQLLKHNFTEVVKRTIEETGMNPRLLICEITERMAMSNIDKTLSIMRSLKDMGIRFALDNFGQGTSSFKSLKKLPLDSIKLDQSFMRDVPSQTNMNIVKALISMSGSLGLKHIATGVETGDQMQFLLEQGCDYMQGFLLSKPAPAMQVSQLITRDRTSAHSGMTICQKIIEHHKNAVLV